MIVCIYRCGRWILSRNMSFSASSLSLRLSIGRTWVWSFKTLDGLISAMPRDTRKLVDEPFLCPIHGDAGRESYEYPNVGQVKELDNGAADSGCIGSSCRSFIAYWGSSYDGRLIFRECFWNTRRTWRNHPATGHARGASASTVLSAGLIHQSLEVHSGRKSGEAIGGLEGRPPSRVGRLS